MNGSDKTQKPSLAADFLIAASVAVAAFLAVLYSHAAFAQDWSIYGAYGQGQYGPSSDGAWHQQQEGRETHRNFRPNGWELGVRYQFQNKPWSIQASKFYGGMVHMSALAIGYPSDDAAKHDPNIDVLREECFAKNTSDCLNRYRGDGNIRGYMLIGSYDFFKKEGVTLSAGAGISVYQASWNAQVYPMDPQCLGDDNKCKWRETVDQKTDWLMSPVLQLRAKVSYLFVQGTSQLRTAQHAPITPGYGDSFRSFLVGVEIPL